jgi:tetratricopeptide (TPR) repeat protein
MSDKKPFYMQAAVPESRQDWPKLADVSTKWTQAEPKNTEAWYALGLANENLAQPDLALKAFQQAANLDKGNFEAVVHIGILAKNKGDAAEMHRVQVVLNDIDKDLINTLTVIRDNPEKLINGLAGEQATKERHAYYKNEYKPKSDLQRAVRWFYLNRTSYSGIMNMKNCYWGYGEKYSMRPENWPRNILRTSL